VKITFDFYHFVQLIIAIYFRKKCTEKSDDEKICMQKKSKELQKKLRSLESIPGSRSYCRRVYLTAEATVEEYT
jgi:hypothetical protein